MTAPQDLQVTARDLPAVDVADPVEPQDVALDAPQPGVGETVTEHPPDERQEVEVAGQRGRARSSEPEPGLEERPVERPRRCRSRATPRPGAPRRPPPGKLARRPGRAAGAGPGGTSPLPRAQPDQEGERAGGRAETGRLRIEADERDRRIRMTREVGQPAAVDPQAATRSLDPDEHPSPSADHFAAEHGGEPLGPLPDGLDAARRHPGPVVSGPGPGGPPAFESPLEGGGVGGHPAAAPMAGSAAAAPRPASSRRASAFASTSGSRRGPVQAGQPDSQPHRAISSAAPSTSSSWPLEQALARADPARHRLVEVDRRSLVVRRADLGHQAEVARVDHQEDARDGLDRPPGADEGDVELVAAPRSAGTDLAASDRLQPGGRRLELELRQVDRAPADVLVGAELELLEQRDEARDHHLAVDPSAAGDRSPRRTPRAA